MTITIKITNFWYVRACSLVDRYQQFRAIFCQHFQSRETADSSKTLVPIQQTTCCYIADDSNLHPLIIYLIIKHISARIVTMEYYNEAIL
jgi:hypothetical protein